jgi:hypothetical protein
VVDLNALLEGRLIDGELGGQVAASLGIEEAKGEGCEEGVLQEEAREARGGQGVQVEEVKAEEDEGDGQGEVGGGR